MKIKILLILSLAFLSSIAFPQGASAKAGKAWTHLFYVNYDNDNSSFSHQFLQLIAKSGSDEQVNIVVQLDNNDGAIRTYVKNQGLKLLEDMGKIDSADPKTFYDFIVWGVTQYPAERYMITIFTPDGSEQFSPDASSGKAMPYEAFTAAMVKVNEFLGSKRTIDIVSIGVPQLGAWTSPPIGLFQKLAKAHTAKFYMTQIASMGLLHAPGVATITNSVLKANPSMETKTAALTIADDIVQGMKDPTYFPGYEVLSMQSASVKKFKRNKRNKHR